MTAMRDILAELRGTPGVKGCSVVTKDGIAVESSLGPDLREDVVAGLTSLLVSRVGRALEVGGMIGFSRFVMNSSHGKVILMTFGEVCLVVITDQFASPDHCAGEIRESVMGLRQLTKMESPRP